MSLLDKPIEEVIETLYNSIKSKRAVITNIKKEYNIDNDNFNDIKINRFKLIELLDEFEVTISQSLQVIQTFKVEIYNLKEKQATEEILNLTNEFQMKYNFNNNISIPNKNNILDKNQNSIIEPKNDNNKNNNDNNNNLQNLNVKEINNENNNIKDFSILKEAKLNFDYSSLLNNSEISLKTSITNLDKYKINNNKANSTENNKVQNDINISQRNEENKNIINNDLKEEDIVEEQPTKLNINIIRSNNNLINKMEIGENKEINKDNNLISKNIDFNEYNNKYYSMRQSDIYNNKNYNYKFNLLNNDINTEINTKSSDYIIPSKEYNNSENMNSNNTFNENEIISLVSKNDILKEKYKKLENDEKINKLIEEIFSIKPFKLYILDKFGNGNKKIFFEKIKKGEINTDELESELNILKEIYDSNNNDIHDKYPMTETKKGEKNKNNKFMNKTLSEINLNMNNMNMSEYNGENNAIKAPKNKYKKINKNNKFKNGLKEVNKSNISNDNNSFGNSINNKNKINCSHSVSSIRARIKNKKF